MSPRTTGDSAQPWFHGADSYAMPTSASSKPRPWSRCSAHAIGEPATRDDIQNLATRAELKTELVALEARLTWRFAGAMLAQTPAILGGVLGIRGVLR